MTLSGRHPQNRRCPTNADYWRFVGAVVTLLLMAMGTAHLYAIAPLLSQVSELRQQVDAARQELATVHERQKFNEARLAALERKRR